MREATIERSVDIRPLRFSLFIGNPHFGLLVVGINATTCCRLTPKWGNQNCRSFTWPALLSSPEIGRMVCLSNSHQKVGSRIWATRYRG
ncbi:hypothetical protein CGZ80_10145 [Rhodopirellula sp. MGV]|nr:hypothetical protein CGZ80_10145 [Rhodopirellula sp. MGV]PNY36547.1 hypothetical protein C2E31_11860 [Rhodopirellula baltica]